MKEKISIYILLLILLVSNIYIFNTVLEKRKDIKDIEINKSGHEEIIEEPIENIDKEKEVENNKETPIKEVASKTKDLSNDIDGFEVITSGYIEGLGDFVLEYIRDLYNYDSLEDKKDLNKYYSEEKLKRDIEKEKKFKEELKKKPDNEDSIALNMDRYDEKSKLSKYEILTYSLDENNYIVEVVLSRTASLIDKNNNIETSIDGDKAYKHTLRIRKEEDEFRIDNEELRYIEDIFSIRGILNQM